MNRRLEPHLLALPRKILKDKHSVFHRGALSIEFTNTGAEDG